MNAQLQGLANALVAQIIQPIINLLFVAGVLIFVWGLVEFLWSLSSGGEDVKRGKQHMLWGFVGVLIMASVWGIITVITSTICGGGLSSCSLH